ncbi:MAG: YdcF family protein [Pseudomonadales bacterium]|nr:YdcF family protein [Pseudomonadales bacterium]
MEMVFLFKKVVGSALMPMPAALILLLLAGLMRRFSFRRCSLGLTVLAGVQLFLFSWPPVSGFLMMPLENSYPAYREQPVDYVVVLGGGHREDERIPVTSLLTSYSTSRLLEGIRIYRQNPGSTLYLSGYQGMTGRISNAEAMRRLALALGVPEGDMILESRPKDTATEAVWVKAHLGANRFALVTSASHMRRAVALFQGQGLNPVPAPTDYLVKRNGKSNLFALVPSSGALATSERALHEYLGYAWALMRGQLQP